MEIAFVVICVICGLMLGVGIGFGISKIQGANKLPEWAAGAIGVVLALGGLFAGFWFADAYKQHLIEQEHARQYDNCMNHDLTKDQCKYFQDMLNN